MWEAEEWHVQHVGWMLQQTKPKHVCRHVSPVVSCICSLCACHPWQPFHFDALTGTQRRISAFYPATYSPASTNAAARGHLDQHRHGLESTAERPASPPVASPSDSHESPHTVYVKTVFAFGTSDSDLTGRFPIQSTTGRQYLFIPTMDGYIHAGTMTSRHYTEYVKAYQRTTETSLQLEIAKYYYLILPSRQSPCPTCRARNLHLQESSHCDIVHYHLWLLSRYLGQIEICFNHLLPYKPDPTVSTYAGSYDFHVHPLAPLGTELLIHDKLVNRSSWSHGFYIGPALQHYRFFKRGLPHPIGADYIHARLGPHRLQHARNLSSWSRVL